MHGKTKQHKAPAKWATKVTKPVQVSFNLAEMTHNYAVLKRLVGLFNSSRDNMGNIRFPESRDFFDGKAHSYEEWFDALGVDQDKFDNVMSKLNKQRIRSDADAIFIRIVEAKEKEFDGKVVLPSDYSYGQVEQAKRAFKEKLKT